MSFVSGNLCSVLIGVNDLSAYFNSADVTATVAPLDATTFTKTRKSYVPGLTDGTIDLGGFFDQALDTILYAYLGSAAGEVVTVAPAGLAVGAVAKLTNARHVKYGISTPVGGLVAVKAMIQADGGVDSGYSLRALSAATADGDGTSVDNGAATTSGAVAHLHVSAFSGFSTTVFTIADSANNSAFSTIGTFTTVAGTTSERIIIPGTIRRYVRISWDVTGSGSTTFAAALART